MKKLILIATIFIAAALLIPFASPVMASPGRIEEPSFETVTYWPYTESHADFSGGRSDVWKKQGTYSYLFSAPSTNAIGNKQYCQITQSSVNFSQLDTISFDVNLSADSSSKYQAQVLVGTTIAWYLDVTIPPTEYLHEEVDVSGYTTTTDLVFKIYTTTGAGNIGLTSYFDNIKLWGSHSDEARTAQSNTFTTYEAYVYMYGENIDDTTDTYKVAYYDGGTAHDGLDGAKLETDEYTGDSDGILQSECQPSSHPSSSYGTWHAVVFKTTGSMPDYYNQVSKADTAYIITDSFTVDQTCIPEFPTIMAAIGVAGLCFGIYYWMRKRRLAYVKG